MKKLIIIFFLNFFVISISYSNFFNQKSNKQKHTQDLETCFILQPLEQTSHLSDADHKKYLMVEMDIVEKNCEEEIPPPYSLVLNFYAQVEKEKEERSEVRMTLKRGRHVLADHSILDSLSDESLKLFLRLKDYKESSAYFSLLLKSLVILIIGEVATDEEKSYVTHLTKTILERQ
jgi:hypothetical protein